MSPSHRLELLGRAMSTFAEAEPATLPALVAREVAEILDAYCGFSLVSEDGVSLESVAAHDRDENAIVLISRLSKASGSIRVADPHPFGRCLLTGECILVAELDPEAMRARFPREEDRQAAFALQIRCVLFVPLRARGQNIGSWMLVRHGENAAGFDDEEMMFALSLAHYAALTIINARLYTDARKQLAEKHQLEGRLRLLTELANEFTAATSDYGALLDLMSKKLCELIGDLCVIRFVNREGTALETAGSVYHPDPELVGTIYEAMVAVPMKVGEGLAGRVAATGEPVVIEGIDPAAMAASVHDRHRELTLRLGIRSLMIVPLVSRGRVVGVASLSRTRADMPYTKTDLAFFLEIAHHAALAIANARLIDESRVELSERKRLADRLATLSELAQEFSAATEDYLGLLQLVARRLSESLGDTCWIRMISADGTVLEECGGAYDRDPARLEQAQRTFLERPQRVGEGISGRVAATGETVLMAAIDSEQLASSLAPRIADVVRRTSIRSIISVPLVIGGKVAGVMTLSRRGADRPYTPEDLQLVKDVASHASLAIANSRLLAASKAALEQRMRTEEVLRRGFLEAAPDPVLILDAKDQIILVNSQAEALFGYRREELLGRSLDVLVPGKLQGDFAVKKDRSEVAVEISVSPIETPDGPLVAAAIRDVTERRRELEERNRRMQEASRLKSEFLANMSHELRTPLNAIIGFAALMHGGKAGPISDPHREYLGDILNSSRHLLQLINDVLDLSKVEAGRMEVRIESVEVAKLVSEVRDIVRALAAEKRLKLEVEIDAAVSRVSIDARMVKQVLYNFLSNAIKFTPEGGSVRLHIRPDGDEAFRIDVQDTGIGIKPEDMNRLFVEFQQLDASTSKKYPGTGLGLALTKRIVEAQHGRVEVTSTFGVGSTFSAIIPREVTKR